jgi:hypothetical protein
VRFVRDKEALAFIPVVIESEEAVSKDHDALSRSSRFMIFSYLFKTYRLIDQAIFSLLFELQIYRMHIQTAVKC